MDTCDGTPLCQAKRSEREAGFLEKLAMVQIAGMVIALIAVIVVYHFVRRRKNENSN